jgi:predicted phage-related endonuclease
MNTITRLKDKDFSKGRRYIGASDVPTLALMNLRYGQTPYGLWEIKTGRKNPWPGNERSRAGKELEPIALKWGLDKIPGGPDKKEARNILIKIISGRDYLSYRPFTESRHNRGYIVSHADLIEVDKPYIMEAKTSGFFGGRRGDDINYGYDLNDLSADGIPSSIYLQIQTQMLCYGIREAYVSAMLDTGIHRLYGPIRAHRPTQNKILALCERFWWHVEKDKPPKPEAWQDVVKMNPVLDKESKTVVGGDNEQKVKEMKAKAVKLRKREKDITAEMEDIKNSIGMILGGNEYLESSSGESLATAFDVMRLYVNEKKLKEGHPKLYKKLIEEKIITESKFRNVRY